MRVLREQRVAQHPNWACATSCGRRGGAGDGAAEGRHLLRAGTKSREFQMTNEDRSDGETSEDERGRKVRRRAKSTEAKRSPKRSPTCGEVKKRETKSEGNGCERCF